MLLILMNSTRYFYPDGFGIIEAEKVCIFLRKKSKKNSALVHTIQKIFERKFGWLNVLFEKKI